MHPFVWLGLVLVVIWGVLWLGLHVISGVVHLVVIAGVALIIWGLLKRGANAMSDGT